jgi:hypothetical protein
MSRIDAITKLVVPRHRAEERTGGGFLPNKVKENPNKLRFIFESNAKTG